MLILILELGFMLYPPMILATSDKKISLFKAKLDNIGGNHLRGLVAQASNRKQEKVRMLLMCVLFNAVEKEFPT